MSFGNRSTHMKKTIIIVVAVVVAVVGYMFVDRKNSVVEVSPSPTESAMVTETPMESVTASPSASTSVSPSASPTGVVSKTKSFTVVGKAYSFTPSVITVNKGDTVMITFQNASGTHDWRIDEFNVHTSVIQGGKEEMIHFVADKTGTFEYYCSVGNHRQLGMKGTLIVK